MLKICIGFETNARGKLSSETGMLYPDTMKTQKIYGKTPDSLSQFKNAIRDGFDRYAEFGGRSSRAQFWYWTLFAFILAVIAAILDGHLFGVTDPTRNGPLGTLVLLVMITPGLAVNIRRLHDIDKSGWWMLLTLTIIGNFLLIYWFCQKGDNAINRFGEEPH